ncbi:MAG: Ig-like domain-containing protein, partial [Nitrosopumilaceae archaeon]
INQTGTYGMLLHSTLFGGDSLTESITITSKFTTISPDDKKPEIILKIPEFVNQEFIITTDIKDENLHIVKHYLDDEEFIYNSTDPIKSESLSEGTHEIKIMAVDVVGNNSTKVFTFIVDKSPPELEIISPTKDIIVSEKISIDFIVNDANLPENEATTILLPTNKVITDQTYYEFDTSNLDDGEYEVQISAKDKAENIVTKTIQFTVDHSIIDKIPTRDEQIFDSSYYLVIGIVIVIGAGLIIAVRKKKISKRTLKQGL